MGGIPCVGLSGCGALGPPEGLEDLVLVLVDNVVWYKSLGFSGLWNAICIIEKTSLSYFSSGR